VRREISGNLVSLPTERRVVDVGLCRLAFCVASNGDNARPGHSADGKASNDMMSRRVRAQRLRLLRRAAREYVIHQAGHTHALAQLHRQGATSGIVSNTGGGFSFDRDPRNRRVSRYRYNSIPVDQPGRMYTCATRIRVSYWSPTARPTKVELDA